ncbi:MAG: hypothetical protein Fur005_13410 [Roseiflexaceae bacterium]
MPDRRRVRGLFALLIGMSLSCMLFAGAALLLRPPRFTTKVDAIGYVLRQQGVDYQMIYLNQGWPDRINSQTYGANLEIVTPTQQRLGGRYECRIEDRNCWIAVPQLGIDLQPVPDLSKPYNLPILVWFDQQWASFQSGRMPWQ